MNNLVKYFGIIIYGLLLYFVGYDIDRGEFGFLITGFSLIGLIYIYFLWKKPLNIKEIIFFGIFFRAILLFNSPNLSDDYYRFIWDGHMLLEEKDPYLSLPENEIVNQPFSESKYFQQLYDGMNSKKYFTVYPPVNQIAFVLSAWVGGHDLYANVLILKMLLFLFEVGAILMLVRLLRRLKLSENLAQIYVLNPLVIIELIGNCHFEGVMLFFIIASIYFLLKKNFILSGVLMAFAINTKLIPIILLPILIKYLGCKKSIFFYLVVGVFMAIMFIPFISLDLLNNLGESVNLYFQTFEFNASIHYLIRFLSTELLGYNLIKSSGYVLAFILVVYVFYKTFFDRNRTKEFMIVLQDWADILFFYYLLASIVHPWYIINLVLLSVFCKRNHLIAWSLVIPLSYYAYSNYINLEFDGDKHQSNWYFLLIFIEYLFVFLVWFFSLRSKKITFAFLKKKHS